MRHPVAAEMGDEVSGALIGEEQFRARDLDDLGDGPESCRAARNTQRLVTE